MVEQRFRDLKPHDTIIAWGGRNLRITRAHFCDGENEPLQLIGGDGWKTSAALRVFFDDGSDDLVHPDMIVRVGALN